MFHCFLTCAVFTTSLSSHLSFWAVCSFKNFPFVPWLWCIMVKFFHVSYAWGLLTFWICGFIVFIELGKIWQLVFQVFLSSFWRFLLHALGHLRLNHSSPMFPAPSSFFSMFDFREFLLWGFTFTNTFCV